MSLVRIKIGGGGQAILSEYFSKILRALFLCELKPLVVAVKDKIQNTKVTLRSSHLQHSIEYWRFLLTSRLLNKILITVYQLYLNFMSA